MKHFWHALYRYRAWRLDRWLRAVRYKRGGYGSSHHRAQSLRASDPIERELQEILACDGDTVRGPTPRPDIFGDDLRDGGPSECR